MEKNYFKISEAITLVTKKFFELIIVNYVLYLSEHWKFFQLYILTIVQKLKIFKMYIHTKTRLMNHGRVMFYLS